MRRWILGALVSLVAAAQAESQPRAAVVADRAALRVESGGNELVALRDARLAELAVDIAQPAEPGGGPIRVARGWPRQLIDYVLCVTSDGTLVLGERLQTFDPGERRYVMTKGEIARSYRPLDTRDGWLWLVEVALSREVTVVLEVRAPASWPVESVSVTADRVP